MAIKFNESGLRTAISQNKSAASNLEVAKNALSNINMPENFSSSYKLRNIPFRIERVKKTVEGINSFIEGKIDEYKAARSKANESASFLSGLLSKFGFGKDRISPNMTNNPDYEYYTKTQAKNTTANNQNLFPYLDASLEQKYFKTMAQMRQTKTSSLTNLTIGVLKGMAKAGETTIKGYQVGQANSISINNPDWNYYANGDKNKINDYARPYKQETMSKVSKKYIQSLYNGFYNTKIGKELNNTAAAPFKTDGAVTKFAENMAYRATIMAAGRVPIGAGFLGFLSGKGEATQSYWSQTKIQSQIKQGKNIDNIFDIGNTYGNAKGVTQGGSMAFQKATGARGIIDEILNKPWKRIVADAIAGGAETVAVAKANSIINGKGFKKTFEQMGGWKTVGASAATAGAISALGELARWGLGKLASGKNDTTTIKKETIENVEELSTAEANITEVNFNRDVPGVVRKEHLEEIEQNVYSASDARLMERAEKTGSYGMEQDVTHKLFYFVDSKGKEIRQGTEEFNEALKNGTDMQIIYTPEYEKMVDYLTNSSFKMSKVDAQRTISMINSGRGVCSYPAVQNVLDQTFESDPQKFQQSTGLTQSETTYDDAQKLIEMYIFNNHEENYGKLFRESQGRTEIIPEAIIAHEKGLGWEDKAISYSEFSPKVLRFNQKGLNEYIGANYGSKEIKWDTSKNISFGDMSEQEYTQHMMDVQKYLEDDNKGIMLTLKNKEVPIIAKRDGKWGGIFINKHAITITGVTEQGVIVSNDGHRDFISHKSLIDSDASIYIITEKGK